MIQKLIIGTLAVLIAGVLGFGIFSALPGDTASSPTSPTQSPQAANNGTRQPQVSAQDSVGDVWSGAGTIIVLEDFGFTLEMIDSSTVYVELGPPDYWQAQSVPLAVGDEVQVEGWNNGAQIHARIVSTDKGELTLRSQTSQPLWAGGANNAQGQNGTQDGTGTNQSTFQVAPEDWITLSGTLTSVTNGAVVLETAGGTVYSLQLGQPNFWQSQGVTLNVGDQVEVLGFWMNEQFTVGDITKTATGEHIILRDPNGRQLWGGPGRNGNGGGGSTGSGQSTKGGL